MLAYGFRGNIASRLNHRAHRALRLQAGRSPNRKQRRDKKLIVCFSAREITQYTFFRSMYNEVKYYQQKINKIIRYKVNKIKE